jgi:hypothetical protein
MNEDTGRQNLPKTGNVNHHQHELNINTALRMQPNQSAVNDGVYSIRETTHLVFHFYGLYTSLIMKFQLQSLQNRSYVFSYTYIPFAFDSTSLRS